MANLSIKALRKIVLATAIAGACVTIWASAYAGSTERPFFRASAIVIGATEDDANAGIAPVASDFVFLNNVSGTAAPDIIGADGFVMNSQAGWVAGHDFSGGSTRLDLQNQTSSGVFSNSGDPGYLEESDSYTAFGLDGTTDITTRMHRKVSRFLVVSNAAFDVYAHADKLVKTGDFTALGYENIGIRVRLNVKGGSGAGRWGDKAQNPKMAPAGLIRLSTTSGIFP